jgi:endonuclease YncB( thermonuclease family)
VVVAFHVATLTTGWALPLTRTGLSPVGTRRHSWRTEDRPTGSSTVACSEKDDPGLGIFRSRLLLLFIVVAAAVLHPEAGFGAENAAAPPAPSASSTPEPAQSGDLAPTNAATLPSAGTVPSIAEWLNQAVRVRAGAQVLDRPSSDGKLLGGIRAGAEVKAIGIVSGGQWVQIELPDQQRAYISSEAVEINNSTGPPPTGQEPAPAKAAALGTTAPEATAAPAVLRGPVTRVPNAATLVVSDQRVRLLGIDPGPPNYLTSFENWIRSQGTLSCEPEAQTGRYQYFTANGVDVAEAAILNGAGRVGDGATPGYRERETEARQGHRGLWQGP